MKSQECQNCLNQSVAWQYLPSICPLCIEVVILCSRCKDWDFAHHFEKGQHYRDRHIQVEIK